MGDFEGRVVLVTGAARGQGFEEARLFAVKGASVVLADRLQEEGEAAASSLAGDGSHVFAQLDVTVDEDWVSTVRMIEERYGRLDVLVNNAGIHLARSIVDTTPEDFRRVIDVNLVGPFLGIRAVTPLMETSGGGSIINISSVQGFLARADIAAYTSSKFGLRGLTKAAAMELGAVGVRVNSVHPGGVATDMIRNFAGMEISEAQLDAAHQHLPIPRCGRPEDVAPMVVFLASDAASYITGAEIAIDGGMAAGIPPRA